jgi:hypothetical protein
MSPNVTKPGFSRMVRHRTLQENQLQLCENCLVIVSSQDSVTSRSRGTLYPQKLALTSPTSGVRSVGIVRLLTHATEFFFIFIVVWWSLVILGEKHFTVHMRAWGPSHSWAVSASTWRTMWHARSRTCIVGRIIFYTIVLPWHFPNICESAG